MSRGDFQTEFERVRREDLLLFVNAGLTATGQGGFYHGAVEERLSLNFLHSYIAENYRGLYSVLLAAGLNDHNLAHAVFTLLRSGPPSDPTGRELENALLEQAVKKLPPQRAYRLFERLADERVNNRRTRALIWSYLRARKNLAFDAVKYRPRLKKAVLHSHFKVDSEIKQFLFQGARAKAYRDPLLETYRKAHYDRRAVYELPFSVAQGLAQRFRIPKDEFLEKIAPRMTEREKLRWQNAGAQKFDPNQAELVELSLYFLRLPEAERPPILVQMRQRAQELSGVLDLEKALPKGRIAAIFDRSYSSTGSRQTVRRPLAVALAVHLVLEAGCPDCVAYWSFPTPDLCALKPLGQTGLGELLLDALECGPETMLVVSDARENQPQGACEAIAAAVSARLPHVPNWIHLNPVFDPDDFSPMGLGPTWPSLGLRRIEDLPTAFALARFARGALEVEDLESLLRERADILLGKESCHAAF